MDEGNDVTIYDTMVTSVMEAETRECSVTALQAHLSVHAGTCKCDCVRVCDSRSTIQR